MTNILRIDASARTENSVSRDLLDRIIARFHAAGEASVTHRDLAHGVPLIDEDWVSANFTPADARSDGQKEKLAISDELVGEVKDADVLLIGLPIYNFSVPAAMKAWIDQIARAGVTFKYTEYGPKGLLEGKRAIVVVASGGTEMGSDIDFASGYLRHVLGFIGIEDVVFVPADRMMVDAEATLKSAHEAVEALTIAA